MSDLRSALSKVLGEAFESLGLDASFGKVVPIKSGQSARILGSLGSSEDPRPEASDASGQAGDVSNDC